MEKNKKENQFVVINEFNKKFYEQFKVKVLENENFENKLISLNEALDYSKSQELDLVLFRKGDERTPNIVKVIDFNKFLYEQKKKEKEIIKKQRQNVQKIKEVKFHIGIDVGDYNYKLDHIKEFLNDGDKVTCQIVLRGREKINNEIIKAFVNRLKTDCEQFANFQKNFERQGSTITGVLINK